MRLRVFGFKSPDTKSTHTAAFSAVEWREALNFLGGFLSFCSLSLLSLEGCVSFCSLSLLTWEGCVAGVRARSRHVCSFSFNPFTYFPYNIGIQFDIYFGVLLLGVFTSKPRDIKSTHTRQPFHQLSGEKHLSFSGVVCHLGHP